jgi:hypothetical protein
MDWGPKVSEMAECKYSLITPHSMCQHNYRWRVCACLCVCTCLCVRTCLCVCLYTCTRKNQRQVLICYPKKTGRNKQAAEHLDRQSLEPDRQWEDRRTCNTPTPLITATCPNLLDHRYYMPGDLYLTRFRVKDTYHCSTYQKNLFAFLGNIFRCR